MQEVENIQEVIENEEVTFLTIFMGSVSSPCPSVGRLVRLFVIMS